MKNLWKIIVNVIKYLLKLWVCDSCQYKTRKIYGEANLCRECWELQVMHQARMTEKNNKTVEANKTEKEQGEDDERE